MNVNANTIGIVYVESAKGTHFTSALVQNAREDETIALPSILGATNGIGIREVIIEGISIQSKENLAWDFYLFASAGHSDADLDLDRFIDMATWAASTGKQIAAAGQYYYPSPSNLEIPYLLDTAGSGIHCSLVNRSAGAKTAAADGAIKVMFMIRPVRGI